MKWRNFGKKIKKILRKIAGRDRKILELRKKLLRMKKFESDSRSQLQKMNDKATLMLSEFMKLGLSDREISVLLLQTRISKGNGTAKLNTKHWQVKDIFRRYSGSNCTMITLHIQKYKILKDYRIPLVERNVGEALEQMEKIFDTIQKMLGKNQYKGKGK